MKKSSLELANFICRFGEKGVLLDYVNEIVLPAFHGGGVRTYGNSRYFFHAVDLVLLDAKKPEVGITGRLVKDTLLESEQVFSPEEGVVKKQAAIPSAPSSMFVLLLSNHRLLYVNETKYAPPLSSFESAIKKFLRSEWISFVNSLHEEAKAQKEPITKKRLREQHPRPSLEIVPIGSSASLSQFIGNYQKLQSIAVTLLEPNAELDNSEFFRAFRDRKNNLGSAVSMIQHRNAEKGLNKDEAVDHLAQPVSQGQVAVVLKGKDDEGNDLRGDNEKFRVRTQLDLDGNTPKEVATKLYDTFLALSGDDLIEKPEINSEVEAKLRQLIRTHEL